LAGSGEIIGADLCRRRVVARAILIHAQEVVVAFLHAARVVAGAALIGDGAIAVAGLHRAGGVGIAGLIYDGAVLRVGAGRAHAGEEGDSRNGGEKTLHNFSSQVQVTAVPRQRLNDDDGAVRHLSGV
jgi:hypothetical protein